jgi:ectoine hydroxylase-related dioxygenase (phytanoyl-CoA dioxygenase family)
MDRSWLEHCITDEQRRHFDEQGYLIVEDALPPEMVRELTAVVDRIAEEARGKRGGSPDAPVDKFRAIVEDGLFLELLDWPRTFPLVWDILGWNIQLYLSHMSVVPPEPADTDREGVVFGGWHQDGGRPVRELERPQPRLSLKVSYWLSDVRGEDRGAMKIVPGSHKLDTPPPWSDPAGDPDGAVELRVAPGTAVLFERRLWHSRSHNFSDTTRKALFFGYSYRWLRGLDYNVMPEALLAKCDPIRRQLLGDGATLCGWWQPREEDVPLRTWIREHRGVEPADPSPL